MEYSSEKLELFFDGEDLNRQNFLSHVGAAVRIFIGETMTLDALVNEIVKNIFDHAGGKGFLLITKDQGGRNFEFIIRDEGQGSYDFEKCLTGPSRLAGNKINCGLGLGIIRDLAESLNIDLSIDTSKGFSYSGKYTAHIIC